MPPRVKRCCGRYPSVVGEVERNGAIVAPPGARVHAVRAAAQAWMISNRRRDSKVEFVGKVRRAAPKDMVVLSPTDHSLTGVGGFALDAPAKRLRSVQELVAGA